MLLFLMSWLSGSLRLRFLAIGLLASALAASGQNIRLTPQQRAAAHGQLPLTNFYDTPVPLPPGKPGDLIRSETSDEYDIPDGVSAIHILYRSLSATGQDAASSGVVLVPRGAAPKAGWPVIAWAHPFTAVARPCAPSLMRGLDSGSVLSMFANLGYAVVATDYVGLGTAFRNAGLDVPSNATDVIYAVQAARKAVPQLGAKWIAVGLREGGAAALSIAEIEGADPNYLGSVSIAGTLNTEGAMDDAAHYSWNDALAYLGYSIKTVYPEFRLEDMLTEKGMGRFKKVTDTCSPPPLHMPLSVMEALTPGWQRSKYVHDFFARNALGAKPANAPLLVISGEDEENSGDAHVVARMCGQKDHIDFAAYPGTDANELIGSTVSAQLAWIRARFDGRVTQNTCH